MIRSSKHILKYSNKNKLDSLRLLFSDYEQDLKFYICLIISNKLPLKNNLTSKDLPNNKISHSQWKQIIYKNASEIVRSNLEKVKKNRFKKYRKLYAKCLEKGIHQKFLDKRFSELNINYLKRIKIDIKSITINIDNRLFDIKYRTKEFDEFTLLRLPYFKKDKKRAISVKLPIKHHKHSNKFIQQNFRRLNSIKLQQIKDNFYFNLTWEKDNKEKKTFGKEIAFDIGYKKLLSDSNGKHYGEKLNEIYDKLSKKKRGSRNYKDLLIHKNNQIRKVCNTLDLEEAKTVIVEDLKRVKNKSKINHKVMNKMQYWSYREVLNTLGSLAEIKGFNLVKVNPAYTSQTCSKCGTVDKENRNGEIYRCSCGIVIDADTNAAINILRRGVYNPSNQEEQFLEIL
jgi:IS605 OrfB family transposase